MVALTVVFCVPSKEIKKASNIVLAGARELASNERGGGGRAAWRCSILRSIILLFPPYRLRRHSRVDAPASTVRPSFFFSFLDNIYFSRYFGCFFFLNLHLHLMAGGEKANEGAGRRGGSPEV